MSVVPVSHLLFLQQPAQLVELQEVLLQVPLTHASPAAHTVQVWPPAPHAVTSLPPLHTPFRQQPTHVVVPHVELQAPETHLLVPLHTWHAAPSLPHAVCCVPAMQLSPWQQPLGQEALVHTQSPLTHSRPVLQATQAPPTLPHCALVLPAAQLPWVSQQPVQFDGPQFCAWVSQAPFRHACSEVHCLQLPPPVPHAVWLLPGWQSSSASQQPLQVLDEQATVTQLPL
jgi:hypothetical protein